MRYSKRLLTLLILLLAGSACAAPMTPAASSNSTQMRSYVWYDGDSPRRVWLDPHVVAVFDNPGESAPGNDSASQTVRSLAPNAEQLPSSTPGVRLWRLPQDGGSAVRNLQSLEPDARVSPVLRDSPSG